MLETFHFLDGSSSVQPILQYLFESLSLSSGSMTMTGTMVVSSAPTMSTSTPKGMRKNGTYLSHTRVLTHSPFPGKQWHNPKSAFRPTAGQTSYTKRMELHRAAQATKTLEREMKDEKEIERNRRIQAIKDRRKAKEEKERYEKMAEKMHRKLVERRRKREKRNKLLNSGK